MESVMEKYWNEQLNATAYNQSYLEVVIADHWFPHSQALHWSHQGLIVDKPFDSYVYLKVLDTVSTWTLPDEEILPGSGVPGTVDES